SEKSLASVGALILTDPYSKTLSHSPPSGDLAIIRAILPDFFSTQRFVVVVSSSALLSSSYFTQVPKLQDSSPRRLYSKRSSSSPPILEKSSSLPLTCSVSSCSSTIE